MGTTGSVQRIGVIGLGYVGLVTAALLADKGYQVIGVDLDEGKVKSVNNGVAPFYEPGLDKVLDRVVGSGRLYASTSYGDLEEADIVFIAVGTPSRSDGSIDLSQVMAAARRLGEVLRGSREQPRVVAVKSTVVPGTTRRIALMLEERSGLRLGSGLGVAANPEFLREGKAIEDTIRPSRVVVGQVDKLGADVVEALWRNFYQGLGWMPPFIRVTAETAEMIKYASNALLAMKISFANLVARICDHIEGCDVVEVMRGVGLDPRIGSEYLGAGLGYGGSCLPKDVKALAAYAKARCVDPRLLEEVDRINEEQPLYVAERLEEILGSLEGRVVAVLGAAFKPGTSDTRESRALLLARSLVERGAKVRLHDPNPLALENARRALGGIVEYVERVEDALRGADAAVVATEWDEYRRLQPRLYKSLMRRPLVYDARRIYDPEAFAEAGVEYYAVGRGLGKWR